MKVYACSSIFHSIRVIPSLSARDETNDMKLRNMHALHKVEMNKSSKKTVVLTRRYPKFHYKI